MNKYDYMIVGSGLYGSLFAYFATLKGKRCLVIEKRKTVGGNLYCLNVDGINVHYYGAHIFHTSNKKVWDFVNSIVPFNNFINSPLANYEGEIYNLPFNMNTFQLLWGVNEPLKAKDIITLQSIKYDTIHNLEEEAISKFGFDIYNKLIKGYTEKQWGRKCSELPIGIVSRVPIRYEYNNNYFNDTYQGIPQGGYNVLIDRLLEGSDVITDCDFFDSKYFNWKEYANQLVYSGAIDRLYEYKYGKLEWRSLRFETERIDVSDYQGNAVINYTSSKVPYTRVIEHKHFENDNNLPYTIISKEYSISNGEPYYPINDSKNTSLYNKYKQIADKEGIIVGGRLGSYKYYDMDDVVELFL